MAKTKAAPSFVYPKSQGERSGSKVAWLYYTKREDAVLAADVAKLEAKYMEAQGYDFGYQAPGYSVEEVKEGGHAGMFEVCVP
jgi:hypothetical protein